MRIAVQFLMDITKQKILGKRVNILYRQSSVAIIGMVIIAVAICLLLYNLAEPDAAFVKFMFFWLVALIVVSSLRLFAVSLYHNRPDVLKEHQWLYFYVLWIAISGILWNILYFELSCKLEPVYLYFFIITVAGMTAGALGTYNTSFLAFSVMIISTLGPMTAISLFSDDDIIRSLGIMLLVYIIFLLIASYRLCNQINNLIFNEFMITRLQSEKSQAAMVNTELENEIRQRIATEGKLKEEKDKAEALADTLLTISSKDGLTGLFNRRRFDEFIEKEWNRGMRAKEPLTLIFCDIDCYKSYNDSYGHLAGDDCLKRIAEVLEHFTRRASDFAARYGGEEFAVVLPNTTLEMAHYVAEQIRTGVEDLKIPHQSSTVKDIVTISMGVVTLIPNQEKSTNDLINLADQALYEAKANGRNQTVVSKVTS
jgi:diguanylate cyclase (GGDEF)-like protein